MLALFGLSAVPVFAAITLDGAGRTTVTGGSASITVPSSSGDQGTVCAIRNETNSNHVSTATFGGVTATLIDQGSGNSGQITDYYYALGVPSGSQTFSFTGYADAGFYCWFLSGVDQTSPIDDFGENTGSGTSLTVSFTTTNSTYIVGNYDSNGSAAVTGSSPLTDSTGGVVSQYRMVDSAGMISAGSQMNTWTAAGSVIYDTFAVGINEQSVVPPPVATTTPIGAFVDNYGAPLGWILAFMLILAALTFWVGLSTEFRGLVRRNSPR